MRNLNASLQRALATGAPDVMALQRYDIPVQDETRGLNRNPLADAILADLGIGPDAFDDTALVVVQV